MSAEQITEIESSLEVGDLPEKNRPLSKRELEALALVACGFRYSEAARLMGISIHTLKVHIQNSVKVLSAKNWTHAVLTVVSTGEIPADQVAGDFDFAKLKTLSSAETRVREALISDGYTGVHGGSVADKLCNSTGTIRGHLSSIYEKLGFDTKSTFPLVRLAALSLIDQQRQSQPG